MNFSRGVGGSLSHLWKFRRGRGGISSLQKWKIQEGGGSEAKFPPWWGSGYFLELHNTVSQAFYRASDRVGQKMGNSAAFSREIMRQERSIMRQIMRFF